MKLDISRRQRASLKKISYIIRPSQLTAPGTGTLHARRSDRSNDENANNKGNADDDVLTVANEGKFVAIVSPQDAQQCLNICRKDPLGQKASIIGEVVKTTDVPIVEMNTRIGGKRIVQMPYGRELPRIC